MNDREARVNYIECKVERMFDRLDEEFMADDSEMTQAQYDERSKQIHVWAEQQYAKLA